MRKLGVASVLLATLFTANAQAEVRAWAHRPHTARQMRSRLIVSHLHTLVSAHKAPARKVILHFA